VKVAADLENGVLEFHLSDAEALECGAPCLWP
jgi:hypothetical protein